MAEIPRSYELDREMQRQKEAIFGKKEESSDEEVRLGVSGLFADGLVRL